MYCYNCRSTFDEMDIVKRRTEDGVLSCCPNCGADDIGETAQCRFCGKECIDGEHVEGYCLSCLWNAIDYDVALDYMTQTRSLCEFMVADWFGAAVPEHSSPEFDAFLDETFRRFVANDKLMREDKFLTSCRYFCLPHFPEEFGFEGMDFGEWYANRQEARK